MTESLWQTALRDLIVEAQRANAAGGSWKDWAHDWQARASLMLMNASGDQIRGAYLATDGVPGDPYADALCNEALRRGIDL